MWYAVQIETGREDKIRDYCCSVVNHDSYNDMFILKFCRKRRYYGRWHKESKPIFPGYMFIDTDTPLAVYQELKKIPRLTRLLGREVDVFLPIEESKEQLFKSMIDDNYEVPSSSGVIEGDTVIITSGALKGKEALIKRIDRHKRVAILQMEMFGGFVTNVELGLEVVGKR